MSYLKKLLEGVELEWTVLGNSSFIEIANNGRKPVKSDLRIAGEIPYYGANNIQDYVEGFTHNGIYVLIAEDGTQSIENYSIQWATGKFWANNHVHVLRGKGELDSRFLYHYLKQFNFIPFLSGGGRSKLTKGELEKIPIPIPPLPVQKEIIRILDTFTELTAELTSELTSELTARKKQYSYYREQLLSFEDSEVDWKALGELTSLITKGTTPKNYTDTGIAFIKTEAFDGTYINTNKLSFIDEETHHKELKRSILNHNDILITIAGATIGKCAIVPKEILPANTNQALAIIRLNADVNLKYVFHLIKSNNLRKYIEQNIKGSAQPNLNLEQLNNFIIPYPSPEEQERIVSILDKFDILTTSISEGLPKEIELRKKQYEYYRDLLLTFPKNNIES